MADQQPVDRSPAEIYTADYYRGRGSGYIFGYGVLRSKVFWFPENAAVSRHLKGGSCLDVGCAMGFFLRSLPTTFDRWGVDVSDFALGHAAATNGNRDQFEVNDLGSSVPFKGRKTFELVTCFNVLEHFEDPRAAVRTLFDCCRVGGFVFVRFPFRDPPLCRDRNHYYRPIDEWKAILDEHGECVEERYYFTVWGKFSDVRMPKSLANFASLVYRRR